MSEYKPTSQQQAVIEAAERGETFVVEARAGSGKTTTARQIAKALPDAKILYLAFNKSTQTEASRSFPKNVSARTSHSLAWSIGAQYRDRMTKPIGNAPRVPRWKAAQQLHVRAVTINDVDLPADRVLGLALAAVGRFARSADPGITRKHVARQQGLEEFQAELAAAVLPVAERCWEDIKNGHVLNVAGEHYIKIWALSHPKLPYDAILFDECQPPGTQVLVPGEYYENGRYVPIETLQIGDTVISYDWNSGRLRMKGSKLTDVRYHRYTGDLVSVTTDAGQTSRYTPDHKCIAVAGGAIENKWCLYLMRRGTQFRTGITRGFYGRGEGQKTYRGVRARAWEERADAVWVLDVYDTKLEAQAAEAFNSWEFRIPQVRFNEPKGGRPNLWAEDFWDKIPDLTQNAKACLAAYGRIIEFPFWSESTGSYAVTQRPSIVRACNLLSGMQLITANGMAARARNFVQPEDRTGIKVTRDRYDGDIWSLEVDSDHTYVADELVTHNCQDANGAIAGVIEEQTDAQIIPIGDSAQSINQWNGAVNSIGNFLALPKFGGKSYPLSKSFRFGQAIADAGNDWLRILGVPDETLVEGFDKINSELAELEDPDAILCRTNAGCVSVAMSLIADGKKVAIVGGGDSIKQLAQAAMQLQAGTKTSHPDLLAFKTWEEVQAYSQEDEGADLRPFVTIIDDVGAEEVIEAMDHLAGEKYADVVISTMHKAKGREWKTVRIHTDCPEPKPTADGRPGKVSKEAAMLYYVACTRAQHVLDREALSWVTEYQD